MPATTDKKPWDNVPIRRLVCIGRRATTKGKLSTFFVNADAIDGDAFGLKLPGKYPGQIIDVAMKEDGTWYPASVQHVGTSTNPIVDRWRLEDRAAYGADELRKREARDKKDAADLGIYRLSTIRTEMQRLPHNQQRALLAQVLGYLGV